MPAPITEDYYALLGVPPAADDEALRRAWRGLAARWHPDRAGVEATATFQRLSAAYSVLSDPVARAAYDRRRRPAETATAKPTGAPSRPAAPAVMLSRLSGPIALVVRRGAARFEDDDAGGQGEAIALLLTEQEAAHGGMVMISLNVAVWCPKCAAAGRNDTGCGRCGGRRIVEELYSAWLAVRPGARAGDTLVPSAELPGMVEPVRFRVRMRDQA